MSSLGFRFEDFADYKDPTAGERAQNKLVNLFPIGSDAENLRSFLQEIGSDCRIYKEDPSHIICRYDHVK
jgi:hypothetical protein